MKDAAILIDAMIKHNAACILGMFAGFGVDVARSPGRFIPTICSGGGIYSEMMSHIAVMPVAHFGMALGMTLCGAWHICRRKPGPIGLILFLLLQFGGMAIAVVGALQIFSQAHPSRMIFAMAAFMLVPGWLSGAVEKWAAARRSGVAYRYGPIGLHNVCGS